MILRKKKNMIKNLSFAKNIILKELIFKKQILILYIS